ncbi:MAG TPA: hypothetical protein VIU12_04645 [Chryseolinea sp.]
MTDTRSRTADIIGQVLTDAVIVSQPDTIVAIGSDICRVVGCDESRFNNAPLSALLGSSFNPIRLAIMLEPGHFVDQPVRLESVHGDTLPYVVSGFFLNLADEPEELLILKFHPADEASAPPSRPSFDDDLDDFIYATSHSLRGPLATLKGLINILKLTDSRDQAFILDKMSFYANKLDDRLHKLIYFTESDKAEAFTEGQVTLESLTKAFRSGEDADQPVVRIKTQHPLPAHTLHHGELILALLKNVQLFFVRNGAHRLPMDFAVAMEDDGYDFRLSVEGIELTREQRSKMDVINFGYSEILNNPDFTDIYAAKKIALKLGGQLQLRSNDRKVCASIFIPHP